MQQPSRQATPLSINELLDRYNQLLEGSDDKSILKGITSSAGRSKGKGIAAKLGVDTANKKSADIVYECLLKLINNKIDNLKNNINNKLIDETNSLLEEHEKLLSKLTPETEGIDKAIEAFEEKFEEATDRVSEVTDESVQKAFLSTLNEFKQDNPEHLITLAIEKSKVQIKKFPPNPSEWGALRRALNEVFKEIGLIFTAGGDEKLFINILRAIFTGASEEGELSEELRDNLNDLNHENSFFVYSALDSIIVKLKSIYTDPQKQGKLKVFLSSPSALELFLKSEHENTQDKVGALKYAIPLIEKVVLGQLESLATECDNTEMHDLEKLNRFSQEKLHLITYDYIFSLLNDLATYTKDRSSPELLKAVVTLSQPYTNDDTYSSNDTRIPALKRESEYIKLWIKQDSCADVVESLKEWCEYQQRLIDQKNTLHALREKLSQSQDISSTHNDESNTMENSSLEVKLNVNGNIQDITTESNARDNDTDVSLDLPVNDVFREVKTPQKTISTEDIKIKQETKDVIVQNIMEAISSGEINVHDMAKDAMTNMIDGGFFNGNSDQSPKATTVDENVLLSEAIDETYLVQDMYDDGKFTETRGWNEELKTCIYEGYNYVDKVDQVQIELKPMVVAGSLLAAMLGNKALSNEVTTEQTTPSRNVHSLWGDSNERIANVLRAVEEREERNPKLEQKNSLEQQIITENKTLSTDKSINNEVTTEQTTPSSNVHSLWGDSNERMANVLRSIEERKEEEERIEAQRIVMSRVFFGREG